MTRLFIAIFLVLQLHTMAQDIPAPQETQADSIEVISEGDTVLIESYAERFNPRKALLYSAVLPGLGQAYNKKYWKIPIVYGGLFGLSLVVDYYQGLYKDYKSQLFYILENNVPESRQRFTEDQLRPAIDRARRERDFMIILTGAMYLLQIVDAHVDAHLKEFDVNPNLQVKLSPFMENNTLVGNQTGLSLAIKF